MLFLDEFSSIVKLMGIIILGVFGLLVFLYPLQTFLPTPFHEFIPAFLRTQSIYQWLNSHISFFVPLFFTAGALTVILVIYRMK